MSPTTWPWAAGESGTPPTFNRNCGLQARFTAYLRLACGHCAARISWHLASGSRQPVRMRHYEHGQVVASRPYLQRGAIQR